MVKLPLFIIAMVHILCMYRGNIPPPVGCGVDNSPLKKFFTIGIFKKNASKYTKIMVESHICDNLNQNYSIFLIFNKKKFLNSFRNDLENCLEGNRLISFVHL